MGKLCVRCGHERQPSDEGPETECPGCGVIYARAEQARSTGPHTAQMQLANALRKRRHHSREGVGAFLTFGQMVTPSLITIVFLLSVVINGIAIVYALLDGNVLLAAGCAVSLLATRIVLEFVMVVFRIADDLGAVRELLADQAVEQARHSIRTS